MVVLASHRVTALTVSAVALVVAAGCGTDTGRFNSEGLVELTCMTHQGATPGEAYTEQENGDIGLRLQVLRYYTLNGDVGYCDGEGPTNTDREWANLVVELGGSRDTVAPILDAP